MYWDLKIDTLKNDLVQGYVKNNEEVLQRLRTRLKRELGEWFLDLSAGIGWYSEVLGSPLQVSSEIENKIRSCISDTEGVQNVESFSTKVDRLKRSVRMTATITLTDGNTTSIDWLL